MTDKCEEDREVIENLQVNEIIRFNASSDILFLSKKRGLRDISHTENLLASIQLLVHSPLDRTVGFVKNIVPTINGH